MQDVEFIEYQTPYYDGPAVKLGAGVMDKQAYEAADSRGLFILGGDCASVGVAGGYTQGGGHSPLSSRLGLGADQALEWEVVDGLGNVHTASRTENSDLYWALSGGGPGTYGVVSSLTVKVYQSFPITGALLNFTAEGIPEDTFYTAIGEYHKILPTWTAMGATTIGSISSEEFRLTPFAFPNASVDEAQTLIRPFTDTLVNLGIDYSINITSFSNWLEFYEDYIETTASGYVQNAQYGGNFIPLDVIENQNTALTSAIRGMVEDGVTFVGIGLNASESQVGAQWNSVHPSWRSSAVMAILHSPWPNTSSPNVTRMSELADKMTAEWVPSLESLAPGAGAYMNEADPNEPNWQSAFYGPNYAALRAIKDKYDPLHTFYAKTAVGSEYWEENDSGALCRSR